jgi:SEC-C motif
MMAPKEVAMAKVRRNAPCPCGSGNKAKRCCYGTQERVHDGMLPKEIGDAAIADIQGTDEIELRAYFERLFDLAEFDASLQVRLPGIVTPDMARAINALRDDDGDRFDDALDKVLDALDSPERRLALADAVLRLRDQGRIDRKLAAIAVFELDRPESVLFRSSVAESLAVLAGEQRTPAGLLLATA